MTERVMPERVVIGDYPDGVFALLYCADNKEVIDTVGFDCIITDAPYGISLNRQNPFSTKQRNLHNGGTWAAKDLYKNIDWDNATPDIDFLLAKQVPTIIFGGNYFANLPPSRKWIIWDKGNGMRGRSFSECELAWCSFDGNTRIVTCPPVNHTGFHHNGTRQQKHHPCEKPEPVMEFCIQQLPKGCGNIICDPYMGSASSGVAAIKLGRSFIGIEQRQDYFQIAVERLTRAYEEYERTKNSLFDEVQTHGAQTHKLFDTE